MTSSGAWNPGWAGGRFSIKETAADIGVIATGPTIESAQASAIAGMYWIMCPSAELREARGLSAEAEGSDPPLAFARLLERLLVSFDTEGFIGARGNVSHPAAAPSKVRADLRGETFDTARHPQGLEIKAVTHHDLVVDRERRWVEVLFDV